MDGIKWIQEWYKSRCDGDWEHCYGVKIETLDNPGWSVKIDVRETDAEGRTFEKIFIDNGDDDWYTCWVQDEVFHGCGDPNKLETIISVFRKWFENE